MISLLYRNLAVSTFCKPSKHVLLSWNVYLDQTTDYFVVSCGFYHGLTANFIDSLDYVMTREQWHQTRKVWGYGIPVQEVKAKLYELEKVFREIRKPV